MVTKQDNAKELSSRWRSIGFLSFLKASLPVVATLPRVPCRAGEGTPSNPERQRQKHEANRHDQGARLRVGKD